MDSEMPGKGSDQNSDKLNNPTTYPETSPDEPEISFKKPTLLVGKICKLSKKVQPLSPNQTISYNNLNSPQENKKHEISHETIIPEEMENKPKMEHPLENPPKASAPLVENPALSYNEPEWSGLPESSGNPYCFEVLKNGSIIESINLMKKPFWVFGRLPICDISMQHPTISRYHAVLQYRDQPSEEDPPGFYIYDLGSTHGTFLNGKNNKLKPKIYAPVKVGHMLRLGCSQRSFILTGPDDDQEEESEFTVTQLKEMKLKKIKDHEEKMRQAELEREENRKKEEERGVDWGMGDDDDVEEEDLTENPFAETTNEALYLDDPKKALRGFFEREGMNLEYDCSEQGMGQFSCKVELPLDDEMGKPLVAEVLHRGKKKEAVVQCALEACRILDRLGLLRQATHESKKRKAKNWKDNDYYDSDEDTFLDRTGTIEKKREKRMKVKEPETYEGLIAKEKALSSQIANLEKKLWETQAKQNSSGFSSTEEDSLDSYMKGLSEDKPDKQTISKMKLDLANLKKSHANVVKLANIAKPANIPPLVPASTSANTSGAGAKKFNFPIFGKRKAIPVKFPAKPIATLTSSFETSQECEVESEEEDDSSEKSKKRESFAEPSISTKVDQSEAKFTKSKCLKAPQIEHLESNAFAEEIMPNSDNVSLSEKMVEGSNEFQLDTIEPIDVSEGEETMDSDSSEEAIEEPMHLLCDFKPIKNFYNTIAFKKFETIMKTGLPAIADKHRSKLLKILRKLHRLSSREGRMEVDYRTVAAKKRKVLKWMEELRQSAEHQEPNDKLEHRVSTELGRILDELNRILTNKFKMVNQVKSMGQELQHISGEIDREIMELEGKYMQQASAKRRDELKNLLDNVHPFHSDPTARVTKNGNCIESAESNKSSDAFTKGAVGIMDDQTPGTSGKCSRSDSFHECDNLSDSEENPAENDERKKKKNQKRNEQRQHKAELEKRKGYHEDAAKENYSMWVPPSDQTGDGRTTLNEKFGY